MNKYLTAVTESSTLKLNEVVSFTTEKVYKFGFGQSPFSPPKQIPFVFDDSCGCEYTSPQGVSELRETISNFHKHYDKLTVDPRDIVVSPGSKMSIFCILASFKKAVVFVPNPSWVSYKEQINILNLKQVNVNTDFDSQWKVSGRSMQLAYDQLCDSEKSLPLIFILNNPGNPNGGVYTREELVDISKFCRQNNIIVISDEIYARLTYEKEHVSMARVYDNTIVTTGLSKWFGVGGWRLGVALFPNGLPEIKNAMISIASHTYSCTPTPIQTVSSNAFLLDPRVDLHIKNQQSILHLIGTHVFQQLNSAGLRVHPPEGGFYMCVDFSNFKPILSSIDIHTDTDICLALLEKARVAALPASEFGYDPNALVIRVAYVDFDGDEAVSLDERSIEHACFANIKNGVESIISWLNSLGNTTE